MPSSPAARRSTLRAVAVERDDAALLGQRVVAAERGLGALVVELRALLELARRARALLLRAHRRVERLHVDLEAALAADVGGEVDREAEGVVELERGLAVEVLRVLRERGVEHRHAVLERLAEALLFLLRAWR